MYTGKWLVTLLAAVFFAPLAWPQASTGNVTGTVRDQSGAVVPSATVVMLNTATNISSNTRPNEAGVFYFPGVSAGSYSLTVEAPGMAKFEGSFTVQALQSVVIDPVLKPSSAVITVEVQDITPMVTVNNATVGTTMEHARIEQLPTNGRSVTTFLATLPGFEGTRTNGSQTGSQEWIVDGSVETDRRWGNNPGVQPGGPSIPPGLDSVQEFTVEQNAVSAKFSRPVSLVMSTKSGSNRLRGDIFETARNNGLGLARARTDNYTKPPEYVRNEFGGAIGGPVFIPKVYNGKDKTFWFASYEAFRLAQAFTGQFSVPTVAMRNGDFSGLTNSSNQAIILYDPLSTAANGSRTPFIGNQIPASRQSPLSKYLFGITPLPTNNSNPNVGWNYYGPQGRHFNNWTFSNRIDHRISNKDQINGRWTHASIYQLVDLSFGGITAQQMLNNVSGWEVDTDNIWSGAISEVHTFSPTFFSELTVSGHRDYWWGRDPNLGQTNWPNQLGLPNPFNSPLWPEFASTTLGNSVTTTLCSSCTGNYYLRTNNEKINVQNYILVEENLTKVLGKHEFLFGFHIRRDYLNILPQQNYPQPQVNYSGMATGLLNPATATNPTAMPLTGNSIGDMFLGVGTYEADLVHTWYYLKEQEAAPYLQDNIKVTKRLTLNLGLRYEYWSPYTEKNGQAMVGFDNSSHSVILGNDLNTLYKLGATLPALVGTFQNLGMKYETYQQAGLPKSLMNSRTKNFGPRLGFAYRALDGKASFVVRGGYSLSYFNLPLSSWLDTVNSTNPFKGQFTYNLNDASQTPDGLQNYLLRSAPTYQDGVNTSNLINISGNPSGVTRGSPAIYWLDPNLPVPREQTWNLSFEKEIASHLVARARYIGTHSDHLGQWYSYNDNPTDYEWYATTGTPKPTGAYANSAMRPFDQTVLGTIQEYRGTALSNYTGVSLELTRQYSHGYAFTINYDMANAFTDTGTVYSPSYYMPGSVPTDYNQRDLAFNYRRDTGIPHDRIRWNWLLDLPVGRGKAIAGRAGKTLDKFIGGWQLAGVGTLWTTFFTLPSGNWNITGVPIQEYGYKYPIQNCTSGTCLPGYLWWNGYIPANQINSHDASGNPNGYEGIPADYKPAVTPLIPYGTTALPANAPANTNISSYWNTNTVWIPLSNGTVQPVSYTNNRNPWVNQYMPGPRLWSLDASLFKNVHITERVNLRFNMDFFNVLNHPDNPNTIGGDGFLNCLASGQSPRALQLSLRLAW